MSGSFQEAYRLARLNFGNASPYLMSSRSGCDYQPDKSEFYVDYAGARFAVSHPDAAVREMASDGDKPPPEVSIILLHYLTYAKGVPLSHRWVSFREITGGNIYYPAFSSRTLRPLVTAFASDPSSLLRSAQTLGGKPIQIAGTRCVAAMVPVLPRVPVGFVLWPGDDEMPVSGNILYDASVEGYLPTEDVVVATSYAVRRLKEVLAR